MQDGPERKIGTKNSSEVVNLQVSDKEVSASVGQQSEGESRRQENTIVVGEQFQERSTANKENSSHTHGGVLAGSNKVATEDNTGEPEGTPSSQPIQRQRRSDMSNEDNDDANDIMDESAARGISSNPALGMNGSELNGGSIKGLPDSSSNALDEEKAIEVVSDDGGDEEDYRDDEDRLPATNSRGGEESRLIGGGGGGSGYWGPKNPSRGGNIGQTATIVASGGVIGSDGNPILSSRPGSRPASPGMMDNLSDISSQLPVTAPLTRSKSRTDFGGGGGGGNNRYSSNFWKARRVLFYRNGDPFFPGIEYRFKPGRDVTTIEALLDKISPRMDLPRGARFIFSMDGDRKLELDELEDGASYVVSSFNKFKVR